MRNVAKMEQLTVHYKAGADAEAGAEVEVEVI